MKINLKHVSLFTVFILILTLSLSGAYGSANTVSVISYKMDAVAASIPTDCGVTVSHENSKNNAIQLALNAAAEGKIWPRIVCVGPGIYPEQLSITSAGGISLVGLGSSGNPAIIEPSSVVVNNYLAPTPPFFFSPLEQAAIIVAGSLGSGKTLEDINIENLVIDGAAASSSMDKYPACSSYAGIDYTGASGSILNNIVRNMYPSPQTASADTKAGCGTGQGIDVDINNNVYTETVLISNNRLPNYSDGGVWCFHAGVTCTITNNDASPYAAYSSLSYSPGGVEITTGASATVAMNTISGNICTRSTAPVCGPNLILQIQGAGVWVIGAAAGTVITDNTFTDNDVAIFAWGGSVGLFILTNTISDCTYAAIVAYDGVGTYNIAGNSLSDSPIGIVVICDQVPSFTANLLPPYSFDDILHHVKIMTFTPGEVVVYFRGHTYTISGTQTVYLS